MSNSTGEVVAGLGRKFSHVVFKRAIHSNVWMRPDAVLAKNLEMLPDQGTAVKVLPGKGIGPDAFKINRFEVKVQELLEQQIECRLFLRDVRGVAEQPAHFQREVCYREVTQPA